jgi:hypothetical protein
MFTYAMLKAAIADMTENELEQEVVALVSDESFPIGLAQMYTGENFFCPIVEGRPKTE